MIEPRPSERKPGDNLIYYRGSKGALHGLAQGNEDRLQGRTLQLNFVNAPAAEAARAVVSDALGETVAVADGVNGVITLTAPTPVPARDALASLEYALAESDLALVETPSGFLLTSMKAAAESPPTPGAVRGVGYGTTIQPVRYATPSEIARLVDPFLSDRVTLTADDAQGAIIIRAPQVDAAEAIEAISTFDAPYLTDRVFGLFRINYADAGTLKGEIESLLSASGVPTGGGTRLIPVPRLNLLFVATRTDEAFREVQGWIDRFDLPSGGDKRRLRYHTVKYTPAEALAAQLNAAFGRGGGSFANAQTPSAETDGTEGAQRQTVSAPLASYSADESSITPDTLNNALLIRATDQEYAEIADLIEKMDIQAPQVLIEATIAEVTLTDDLAFGVRWFWKNAESTLTFSDNDSGAVGPVFPGLSYTYFKTDVRAALDTLSSITDVTVLSAPSIMVLNNQSASLQVGDEVPVVTQQATSVADGDAPIVSTVQLRETGVILEVTPRINASDVVVLEVTQEVSDAIQTRTSGIDSPTIQQRRFTSTVAVSDKGTVALGGLIRENFTDNSSGIPILMKIPVLGNAFKSRETSKRRTELIVFLTPHIIRTESDAQAAFRELRREMKNLYQIEELTQ